MNDAPRTILQINLGNEVTSYPGVGIVIGVYLAKGYKFIAESCHFSDWMAWTTLYPDWLDKLCFVVFYSEPRKPLTWEEWKKGYSRLVPEA